jgi:hypothetical protein
MQVITSLKQYLMILMNRMGLGMPTEDEDDEEEEASDEGVYTDL